MKGLAIHVEQLIIIIVAVLVLLAIITFFLGMWNPKWMLCRAKLTQACQLIQGNGCGQGYINPDSVDTSFIEKDFGGSSSSSSKLSVLDVCKKCDINDETQCLKNCACVTS